MLFTVFSLLTLETFFFKSINLCNGFALEAASPLGRIFYVLFLTHCEYLTHSLLPKRSSYMLETLIFFISKCSKLSLFRKTKNDALR